MPEPRRQRSPETAHRLCVALLAVSFAGLPALPAQQKRNAGAAAAAARDAAMLRKAGITPDTDGVLAYLARLEPSPLQQLQIEGLVRRLAAPRFRVRAEAERRLSGFGPAARVALVEALDAEVLEVRCRAQRILDGIDDEQQYQLLRASIELLGREARPEACAALLRVAPRCDDRRLVSALTEALVAAAAERDEPRLRAAMGADSALLREVVVVTAGRRRDLGLEDLLRDALGDARPRVRLAAARQLADRGDRAVLASLIDLLEEPDTAVRGAAHAVLAELTRRPSRFAAWDGDEARAMAVQQWRDWLRLEGQRSTLYFPLRGSARYREVVGFLVSSTSTGVAIYDWRGQRRWSFQCAPYDVQAMLDGTVVVTERAGVVRIIDREGRELRRHEGLNGPTDADLLPNGHVLVLEGNANRVTELDEQGKVVFRAAGLNNPFDAERLQNGNTLVADSGNNRLVEFDPQGRQVWEKTGLAFPNGVTRLADGSTLYTTYTSGILVMLDPNGEVAWQTEIGGTVYSPDIAQDRIYVAESGGQQIVELDRRGKILRRVKLPKSFNDVSYVR